MKFKFVSINSSNALFTIFHISLAMKFIFFFSYKFIFPNGRVLLEVNIISQSADLKPEETEKALMMELNSNFGYHMDKLKRRKE
jgi:hypothetical protein